jgi:hypothetical protein
LLQQLICGTLDLQREKELQVRLRKRDNTIRCAICFYTEIKKIAQPADTIIAGLAVCYDHMGYAQDERLSRIIIHIKEQNNDD